MSMRCRLRMLFYFFLAFRLSVLACLLGVFDLGRVVQRSRLSNLRNCFDVSVKNCQLVWRRCEARALTRIGQAC